MESEENEERKGKENKKNPSRKNKQTNNNGLKAYKTILP